MLLMVETFSVFAECNNVFFFYSNLAGQKYHRIPGSTLSRKVAGIVVFMSQVSQLRRHHYKHINLAIDWFIYVIFLSEQTWEVQVIQ